MAKREVREIGLFFLAILMGGALGLAGNIWVEIYFHKIGFETMDTQLIDQMFFNWSLALLSILVSCAAIGFVLVRSSEE